MVDVDDLDDGLLRSRFAAYRDDTLARVRPAGALAARRGHERRRRRRLLAVTASAAAAVLAVAGGAYLVADRAARPEPVTPVDPPTVAPLPSVRTPAPAPTPASPTVRASAVASSTGAAPRASRPAPTASATATTPVCPAADIDATTAGGEGAAGTSYTNIVLRNTSSRACALNGYVGLTATDDPDGLVAGLNRRQGPAAGPVTLRAGGTAYALLGTAEGGTCQTYTRVRVVLPGGGGSVALPGTRTFCSGGTIYVGAVRSTPPVPMG
jgi:hypothetical protein